MRREGREEGIANLFITTRCAKDKNSKMSIGQAEQLSISQQVSVPMHWGEYWR